MRENHRKSKTVKQSPQQRYWKRFVITAAVAVLAGFLSIGASFTQKHLSSLNVLPKQQQLTALLFQDTGKLPRHYTPAQPQTVTFTIQNKEGRNMTYHYSVIQQSETGGALLELASGTINVQSGASKNVSATFAPADMGSRSKIVINLDNPAESISYWTYRSTE